MQSLWAFNEGWCLLAQAACCQDPREREALPKSTPEMVAKAKAALNQAKRDKQEKAK